MRSRHERNETKMPKSTENTVFVRFVPNPTKVLRHELEELFSQMGPIKKSSWIHSDSNNNKKSSNNKGGGREQEEDAGGASNYSSKGYGFVKYLSTQDAQAATNELHDTYITMNGQKIQLKVELASTSSSTNLDPTTKTTSASNNKSKPFDMKTTPRTTSHDKNDLSNVGDDDILSTKKKLSRVIVRNLSFYAKENHIRRVMEEQFGKVIDVHLPRVNDKLHVGFCFVTFENSDDAKLAVSSSSSTTTKPIMIQKRKVNIDWSIPKNVHQQQKQQKEKDKKDSSEKRSPKEDKTKSKKHMEDEEREDSTSGSDDDNDNESDDGSSSSSNSDNDDDNDDNDSNSAHDSEDDDKEDSKENDEESKDGEDLDDHGEDIDQRKTLFLRNLPFDTTRHDLFELFYKYGHIKGIYLVKDKQTGIAKGTAFITYSSSESAQKALDRTASNASSFVTQRQSMGTGDSKTTESTGGDDAAPTSSSSSLLFRGRQIMVNLAVDKETAATFDSSKSNKTSGTDRRNMYLQAESRVESSNPEHNKNDTNAASSTTIGYGNWDDIPPQDQRKRQHALKDKTTKLQSPLFFINPNRLSVRNLAKHVDETMLRQLCAQATQRGLQNGLVSAKDQIAHWKAPGELSTRDIMSKVQQMEAKGEPIIPEWNTSNDNDDHADNAAASKANKNIREYITSEYIDRDFVKGTSIKTKKADAPSRGYGFIEFTHHVHALACLRELNNNPAYSKEYAAGGSIANALKKKNKKKKPSGSSGSAGGAAGGANSFIGEDGRVLVPRLIVDFVVSLVRMLLLWFVERTCLSLPGSIVGLY